MKKITSVLFVDEIELCLPFWIDLLGFEKFVEVPEGDRLGFVILKNGSAEVMLQSFESIANDVPALAEGSYRSSLFIQVDDLQVIENALTDVENLFPKRTTFYGATEIGVHDPAGNVIVFAQFADC